MKYEHRQIDIRIITIRLIYTLNINSYLITVLKAVEEMVIMMITTIPTRIDLTHFHTLKIGASLDGSLNAKKKLTRMDKLKEGIAMLMMMETK